MTVERKNLPNFCNIHVIFLISEMKMLCPASSQSGRQDAGCAPRAAGGWGTTFWGREWEEKAFVIPLHTSDLLPTTG